MNAFFRTFAVTLLGLAVFCGCNGRSPLSGNSSGAGDDSSQDQKQQPQQKKPGGQAGADQTEPTNSVSGQPSAASDRGTPDAVAHRSVAQPGAPQGTAPDSSQNPPPKPAPPQH